MILLRSVPAQGEPKAVLPRPFAVAGALIAAQEKSPEAPLLNEVVLARMMLRPDAPSEAVVDAEVAIREMIMLRVPVWRRLGIMR